MSEIPTPERMPAEQWDRFKKHREEFKEAFKHEAEDDITSALQDLPGNIREADDWNSMSYKVTWEGASLHDIACYYAMQEVGEDPGVAVCSIEELKRRIEAL